MQRKYVIKGHEEELLDMAKNGLKPKEMAEILNINPVTINSWFRTKHPEITFLPKKGNVNYFHTINSYAKAYIIGFIAADGALVKNSSHSPTAAETLTITVKYEDKEVLEFIKKEIGNEHKLLEIIRPSSFDKTKTIHHIRYTISDINICNDLHNLGISSNKSLTIKNIIEHIPYEYRDAFIIGYFDGDGSVSVIDNIKTNQRGYNVKDYSLYINIRGTEEFLSGICKHLDIPKSYIHKYDSIATLNFAAKKYTVRFFQCYNNLPFFYRRKYNKFLQRINHKSYDKYKQVQTISSSTE